MKNLLLVFLLFLTSGLSGDILVWTVGGSASVDNGPNDVYTFIKELPYTPMDLNDFDAPYTEYLAQVVAVDRSGQVVATLPVAFQTNPEETNPLLFEYEFDPDITCVEIGHHNAGYFGADWKQSRVSGEMLAECLFQMQILQDSSGVETTLLYSDYRDGDYLQNENNHTYVEGSIAPDPYLPWTPDSFYTINPVIPIVPSPEPTSSLLMLVGSIVLFLKRKHN